MSNPVSNPNVTLNIIPRTNLLTTEDTRNVIIGQKSAAGTADAGLVSDISRTDINGINDLFGADSHLAMLVRAYRNRNGFTDLDVIALDDDAGGIQAEAAFEFEGTATAAGTLTFVLVNDLEQTHEVDVLAGDTAADVRAKLSARLSLGRFQTFTFADDDTGANPRLVFTNVNAGQVGNDQPIAVIGKVTGITVTADAWAGGATDPILTGIFDPIETIRYTGGVWPEAYTDTILRAFAEGRRNVDNDIQDGRWFRYRNLPLAAALAESAITNSSEIVYITNATTDLPTAKGTHVLAAGDVLSTEVMALRALRLEPGVSISSIVTTNEPLDQFGGVELNSLPYFNTPLSGHLPPINGTGYTQAELRELENGGLSVVGGNPANGAIVLGDMVTTYQFDPAGNDNDTWQYLNWRDTHGAIREIFVRNFRARFAQYRLTSGSLVAGRSIANEQLLRAYAKEVYASLGDATLVQKGRASVDYFDQNLTVSIDSNARQATINMDVVMVSQLASIIGNIQFTFDT